jgi:hypothetical protein
MNPIEVASHEEAMRLCLDQLYRKERYIFILHRKPVVESQGQFGSATMFSGLHRACRLQEPAPDKTVSIRYVSFGGGSLEDKEMCYKVVSGHMMSLRSLSGYVRERLFAEVMEIFTQALSL